VFLAAVRAAEVGSGAPLAYYRGRFGRLEIAADDDALRDVRRAVLRRAVAVDERLDPEALAQSLAAPVSSVEFALAQLLSERLVTRDADGYRQVALDARRSDDAFDAKLVIDLGAAQMAMTRAGDTELAQLEELAATTVPPMGEIGPELVQRMVAANEEFHETAIALAGNAALLDAYRQLRLTSVLSPVMWRAAGSARRLAEQHQLIASALRARDLARAQELITTHNRQARASHHQAIEVAGGCI
jgi:DNA-binding GntR family transcriptional regulator